MLAIRHNLHAIVLLMALVGAVAAAPLLDAIPVLQSLLVAGSLLPIWYSVSRQSSHRRVALAVVLAAVPMLSMLVATGLRNDTLFAATAIAGGVSYAVASVLLLFRAFRGEHDNTGRLLDGINAYLLIGFTYASLYIALDHFFGGVFTHPHGRATMPWGMVVYYSFSTLTTTGYGDVVPAHPFVRGLSSLEQLSGVLYTAALIGRILGLVEIKRRA